MSKHANAGELRTPVYFCRVEFGTDADSVPTKKETNIYGVGVPIRCKWVNAHGSESFQAMQLQLRDPATITCRYSPSIKEDLIVYKSNDPRPYEIISIDNVGEQNRWLEIHVQRKVPAK